jgi:hypothetical protein
MEGGIGDDIVLEQTSQIELRKVIRNVTKYKLIAFKVLSAPRNIIGTNIVTSRRK